MIKILIVEDEKNKCKQIEEYVYEVWQDVNLTSKLSYHSGLKEIISNKFDIILMDMTLPTYDVTIHENGGPILSSGGLNILSEMMRKKIISKVIIVTQYESFGTGADTLTLDQLKVKLEMYRPNYIGTVYFNTSTSKWKDDIQKMINSEVHND